MGGVRYYTEAILNETSLRIAAELNVSLNLQSLHIANTPDDQFAFTGISTADGIFYKSMKDASSIYTAPNNTSFLG
jgi:hypothetical protein